MGFLEALAPLSRPDSDPWPPWRRFLRLRLAGRQIAPAKDKFSNSSQGAGVHVGDGAFLPNDRDEEIVVCSVSGYGRRLIRLDNDFAEQRHFAAAAPKLSSYVKRQVVSRKSL